MRHPFVGACSARGSHLTRLFYTCSQAEPTVTLPTHTAAHTDVPPPAGLHFHTFHNDVPCGHEFTASVFVRILDSREKTRFPFYQQGN